MFPLPATPPCATAPHRPSSPQKGPYGSVNSEYYVTYFIIFCPNTILHYYLSCIALYPYTVTKCFQDWSCSTFRGDQDQETVQITSNGWRAGTTLDNVWEGLEVVGRW